MKDLWFSIIVCGLCGLIACDPSAEIPSYIQIDSIVVDSTSYDSIGSHASQVSFAWVYINDDLQGVYLLPAKFPVLGEGEKNIQVLGGVYEFGNGHSAIKNPFFDPWEITGIFIPESTLVLTPHIRYNTGLKIQYLEDFENASSPSINQTSTEGNYIHSYSINPLEGSNSGYLHLANNETELVVETNSSTLQNVPKGLSAYFVELHYQSNTPFSIGLKTSQGSVDMVQVSTHNTWFKAYINITPFIDILPGNDVGIVLKVIRDMNIPEQEVFIDNLKLMYR